jgi:hypothetical protein
LRFKIGLGKWWILEAKVTSNPPEKEPQRGLFLVIKKAVLTTNLESIYSIKFLFYINYLKSMNITTEYSFNLIYNNYL